MPAVERHDLIHLYQGPMGIHLPVKLIVKNMSRCVVSGNCLIHTGYESSQQIPRGAGCISPVTADILPRVWDILNSSQ